jgi:hypothetical protein
MNRIVKFLIDVFLFEWTAIAAFVGAISWTMWTAAESGFHWVHGLAIFFTAAWVFMLMAVGFVSASASSMLRVSSAESNGRPQHLKGI